MGIDSKWSMIGIAAAIIALGGCSAAATGEGAGATTSAVAVANTTVIDVRTPAEYASGHLSGAVNYDVNGANFDAQLAALDPTGNYTVYCRSGNRSAEAARIMAERGFSHVTDAGGLSEAESVTGLPVVN